MKIDNDKILSLKGGKAAQAPKVGEVGGTGFPTIGTDTLITEDSIEKAAK